MGRKMIDLSAQILNELADICNAISTNKGFNDGPKRSFGDIIALVHSELSEALEEYRNGHSYTEIYYNDENPGKPEGIPIELADALIRILQFSSNENVDIGHAVALKIAYNETRPHKHGGKVI